MARFLNGIGTAGVFRQLLSVNVAKVPRGPRTRRKLPTCCGRTRPLHLVGSASRGSTRLLAHGNVGGPGSPPLPASSGGRPARVSFSGPHVEEVMMVSGSPGIAAYGCPRRAGILRGAGGGCGADLPRPQAAPAARACLSTTTSRMFSRREVVRGTAGGFARRPGSLPGVMKSTDVRRVPGAPRRSGPKGPREELGEPRLCSTSSLRIASARSFCPVGLCPLCSCRCPCSSRIVAAFRLRVWAKPPRNPGPRPRRPARRERPPQGVSTSSTRHTAGARLFGVQPRREWRRERVGNELSASALSPLSKARPVNSEFCGRVDEVVPPARTRR